MNLILFDSVLAHYYVGHLQNVSGLFKNYVA